jgi:hypothetical protein
MPKARFSRRLLAATAQIVFLFLSVMPAYASDGDLEDILEGFDEPAASSPASASDPALDGVMEGFDEEPGNTDSDDDLEGVLEGFEEPPVTSTAAELPSPDSPWQWSGAITLASAYNFAHDAPAPGMTDYRGFSRLRVKLDLETDYRINNAWKFHADGHMFRDFIYQLRDQDYTDEVLDDYRQEIELDELYIQGSLTRSLDLKLGRQIVVWGKSDNLRVTDVLNPLDLREPGMVDIEDLRLPTAMTRLDWYVGDWNLSAILVHERRFNRNPAFGSDFYPFPVKLPHRDRPHNGISNTEYALAFSGVFSGWDIAFYAADLYVDQPHQEVRAGGPVLEYARSSMVGSAVNIAIGNWLLKGEAAHFRGLEYSSLPGEKRSRSDLLLGVEYSGFDDASLSFELVDRHLHNYDPLLRSEGVRRDELQSALRFQGDYLHDRLHLILLNSLYLQGEPAGFSRASLGYDLADALTLTGGLVLYHGGEKMPFGAFGDNDRLFLDLKYSF